MSQHVLRKYTTALEHEMEYLSSEDWKLVGFFSEKREGTEGFCLPTYLVLDDDKEDLNGGHLSVVFEEFFSNNANKDTFHIFRAEERMRKDPGSDYHSEFDTYIIYVKINYLDPFCQMIKDTIEEFDLYKCVDL